MKRNGSKSNILLPYAIGTFGMQIIIGFAASFQAEFYNKMYAALDPYILSGCAIILFVSKFISSLLDPLIGVWIDREGRSGVNLFQHVRRSIFPLAFLTVILFIYVPFDSKLLMYAYITLTSVLWSVAMSFAEIPAPSAEGRDLTIPDQSDFRDRTTGAVVSGQEPSVFFSGYLPIFIPFHSFAKSGHHPLN